MKTITKVNKMTMHNPPHVGEILKEEFFDHLDISITEMAKKLGIARQSLSNLLNQKSGISPEMAVKLSKALNTTAEFWMELQIQYEIFHAKEKMKSLKIELLA